MSQRTGAGLLALGLMAVLWAAAALTPLPYVTYVPGPTLDLLASPSGQEIIDVSGHESFPTEGELRLTTIYVSDPEEQVELPELLTAYFDDDQAVYPRSAVYAPEETDESSERMSDVQMLSSQDTAVAVALTELGYEVPTTVRVLEVVPGMPADGVLQPQDELIEVGFGTVKDPQDVGNAINIFKPGDTIPFKIKRDGEVMTVDVKPKVMDDRLMVGITPGLTHEFPFEVDVNLADNIGGPSAGLMLALAVYDTLTPGPLTEGRKIAGTGTIGPEGAVGPIGGAQQKIAASRESGVELFLVPSDNCSSVGSVDTGDMRLASVASMDEALDVIQTWTADEDADLPTCEDEPA